MYICICKGVSEKELLDVVHNGSSSLQDVQNSCGAGTDCGACCSKVEKYLNQHAAASICECGAGADSRESCAS